ncbi:MAG: oxidoreductase [Spirochaetes bacterium]|jgi:threonine dehydrogenase-like Zn-dependent dehydrogenase|nr:oxidoreductase [Spirochaetota bacterium]
MTDRRRAKAVFFVEPGRVEAREIEVEGGDGEVLVESTLCGVSHGTERLFFRGEAPERIPEEPLESLDSDTVYPVKYGYMNVGVTEDGQRVFAFYPHQDRFFLPPDRLITLPDDLATEDAVLLPSMETAIGIVHDLGPRLGERVLLAGLGMVGLTTAALLRFMRIEVVAIDGVSERRKAAEDLGCGTLDPQESRGHMNLGEFDGAINLSGSSEALQLCIEAVAGEATVVEASWYGGKAIDINLGRHFHHGRVTLRSAQVSRVNPALQPRWSKTRRFELAMELAQRLRPGRYITHRFGFSEVQRAFELIDSGDEGVLQVVLDPTQSG